MSLLKPRDDMSGAGIMVVGALCGSLLLAILTLCIIAVFGRDVPQSLETVIAGLLVGVPALLAKTYRGQASPPPDTTAESEIVFTPDGELEEDRG